MTESLIPSLEVAKELLRIKAVHLDPVNLFTWASGIKSPIYCDNRQVISYPETRNLTTNALVQLIKLRCPQAQVIAGTATAGIPHAAWIAERLGLPMIYVRGESKGHGLKNNIEGKLIPDSKVVVIEDLISTGGSSVKAAMSIKEAGGNPLAVLSIFTYNLAKAKRTFGESKLETYSICTLEHLLEVAIKTNLITAEQKEFVLKWRETL